MVCRLTLSSCAAALLAAVLVCPPPALAQTVAPAPEAPAAPPVEAQPAPTAAPVDSQPASVPAATPAAEPGAGDALAPPHGAKVPGAVEEIVVTGSRIRRTDLTTAAPVTVMSKDDFVATGKVSIGDILQNLPSQSGGTNTQVNNGGDGSTRVSLRGLGPNRTLVLVNGRRHVAGGLGADSSVDLNAIPAAVIERLEILKDGASAVYGSDAMGGVINIITRKNFQGAEATAYTGTTQHSDGTMVDVSATAGQTSENGNVVFSAGYYRQAPVWAGDRNYSRIDHDYDYDSKEVGTTGSGTVPQGRISGSGLQGNKAWRDLYGSTKSNVFINDNGNWRDFNSSGVYAPDYGVNDGDFYNYQPKNYILTPQERYNVYSIGNYQLGSAARAYFEASYTSRQSETQLAPEPLMTQVEGITVSKDNIYNPFGRDFTDVRRRLSEFGNRISNQAVDTFRLVSGLDGTLSDAAGPAAGWFWDLSFNYGRTQATKTGQGNLKVPRLKDALGPSFIDSSGTPTCGTPEKPIAGCVPLNLFDGEGSITKDMTTGLTFRGIDRGFTQQAAAQANISGELIPVFSERPVGLAVGYEHRREMGANYPDPISQAGEVTGNKSTETAGLYDVDEGYAELSIPVINGVTGAEDLELSAAARAFRYSTFGANWTWKLGGRWKPIVDLTIRGTLSTAFRAPNIGELYSGNADDFPVVNDPCNTIDGDIKEAFQAGCAAQKVTGVVDDRSQQQARVGGNPKLQPETANIITGGFVLEPSALEGFSLTLDYYRIKIASTIGPIGSQIILNSCYTSGQYCSLVHRYADGRLNYIDDREANVGATFTDGMDITLKYDLHTEYGRIGTTIDTNYLLGYEQTLADKSVVQGKGNYDLGMNPTTRFIASVLYGYEDFGAGLTGHFVQSFKECENSDCVTAIPAGRYRKVPTYVTFDAFFSYDLATEMGKTSMSIGCNNLLNKDPEPIYSALSKSDPTAYDFIGRWFYVRIAHAL